MPITQERAAPTRPDLTKLVRIVAEDAGSATATGSDMAGALDIAIASRVSQVKRSDPSVNLPEGVLLPLIRGATAEQVGTLHKFPDARWSEVLDVSPRADVSNR